MKFTRLALALCSMGLATGAMAQAGKDNLKTLQSMKVATTDLNIPVVAQEGKNADAIRANLKRIKMPPGFKIELFAVVPDARHMAVAPSTNMLFVGTRKTRVWAVTDRNGDGFADEVKAFAPSLNFKVPNGVCWTKDGFLLVVEHNRVLNFPAAEFFYEGPDVAVIEVVPQGKLIPEEEESFNHGARTCRISDDGKLHITLGQPYNVQPAGKVALYERLGIGGMIRMDAFDGSNREVIARGGAQLRGHGHQPQRQGGVVHRQPDRRHGRRHSSGRTQPHHQGRRRALWIPLHSWQQHANCGHCGRARPQGHGCTRGLDQAAGRVSCAPGSAWHDFLQRKNVPQQVPRRHVCGSPRLLEPHQGLGRLGQLCATQCRWHGRQVRGVCRGFFGP
jgi:hypothetical protein